MGWTTTDSLDAFRAAAWPFLERRPVENSVLLTVADALRRRGADAYGQPHPRLRLLAARRRRRGGRGRAAAPPHPPLLSRGPAAGRRGTPRGMGARARPGRRTAPRGRARRGRCGPRLRGRLGAADRRRRAGGTRHQGLPAGRAHPARERPSWCRARRLGRADRDLLAALARGVRRRHRRVAARRVAARRGAGRRRRHRATAGAPCGSSTGSRSLWPASPCRLPARSAWSPSTPRGAARPGLRPSRHRRRLARRARRGRRREVLLFTDLADPASNRLYQRLGYVPVRTIT